jgi:ABC-type antimicrobial peptide transport system permease subunit
MALGADRFRILGMVVRQSSVQIGGGLLAGLGIAYGIAKAAGSGISGVLFNVSPLDPLIYTVVASIVLFVSLAATFVPARRATRVDPMIALRAE